MGKIAASLTHEFYLMEALHKILIAITPKSADSSVENLFRSAHSPGLPSLHKKTAEVYIR